jgi:hypothetical protein
MAVVVDVRNAGSAAAPATEVYMWLTLSNGSSARFMCSADVPALAAGATYRIQGQCQVPQLSIPAGGYLMRYLLAEVDATRRVPESNEANNTASNGPYRIDGN